MPTVPIGRLPHVWSTAPPAESARRGFLQAEKVRRTNSLFLIWFPLLLAVTAPLALLYTTPFMQAAEELVGTAIACVALAMLSTSQVKLRISRILGTGLLLGLAGGALPDGIAAVNIQTALAYHDPTAHTYALAFCQIFCGIAVLWTMGELTEPDVRLPEFSPLSLIRLRRFAWLGTGLVVVALATGKIGYMGADVVAGATAPGLIAVTVSWMLPPIIGATATALAKATTTRSRALLAGALAFQCIAVVPTGRRNFLYAVLLAFTLYCIWKPSFSRSKWKLSVALLSGLLAISVAWTAFLYLRIASYTLGKEDDVHLSDLVDRAFLMYQSGEIEGASAAWNTGDVTERVDIVSYNVILLDQAEKHPPAFGGGALNEFKWAIPKLFWPGKAILSEEAFASNYFHISLTDEPNSIFSAAIVDFGFWGGLFYPILLSWLLVVSLKAVWRVFPAPVPYLCTCAVLVLCMQTEVELFAYFDIVRSTLQFGLPLAMILAAPDLLRRARGKPSPHGPMAVPGIRARS